MATVQKVGKITVSENNNSEILYENIFDKETIDDNNLFTILGAINKFNIYLKDEITDIKRLEENNIIKSFFQFNKKIKTEIKNIETTLETDRLKEVFNKYALSKLGGELSAVIKFTKSKIYEKKCESIKVFLTYLLESCKLNYYDITIINENLLYYKNYLALLMNNAKIDYDTVAKNTVYRNAILGAIDSEDFNVAEDLINIDFIKEVFTVGELEDFREQINSIKNSAILAHLEAELSNIADIKSVKTKIDELKNIKYISSLDADKLYEKIVDSRRFNLVMLKKKSSDDLQNKLLNIFTAIYNATLDFENLYTDVNDDKIYDVIMRVVENSGKPISQATAIEREGVYKNISTAIEKRYITDINSLIKIKDISERIDIVSMIKILKQMMKMKADELEI